MEGISKWMKINKESIFDTRPWKVYGEGPSVDAVNTLNGAGFNEGKVAYTEKDIRYNQKGNILYATTMNIPTGDIFLKSLGKNISNAKIKKIELLGSKEKLSWKQGSDVLTISKPKACPNDIALVFKITLSN